MFGDFLAPSHIALILIVALLVLGPKRLPEVGKTLGKGLRDFKQAMGTYSPQAMLDFDTPTHATTPPEPDLEPPVTAGAATAAPHESTIDAVAHDDGPAQSTVATPAGDSTN